MSIFQDSHFVVGLSFVLFFVLLAYLGVHKFLGRALDQRADRIREELDEVRRLREEAQAVFAEFERKHREVETQTGEIVAQIEEWDCPHVVLTGGEPMLQAELIPLCDSLRRMGRHITVETAGTLYLPVACDLMSISPKLSNSTPSAYRDVRWSRRHERDRHAPDVVRRLVAEYDYQVKFVVDSLSDCQEVQRYLDELSEIDRRRVMLMPQGVDAQALADRGRWLEPYCQAHGLRFCPRKQVEWFGLVRGT